MKNVKRKTMKKHFLLIVIALLSVLSAWADNVELTRVEDLTSQYFIMAYSDNGTYLSPYWTKGTMQNVVSPGESAVICNGRDYYYLLKAEKVTYKGEAVYRVSISNGLHELFPNGIGGAAYLNSAGWCFFAGESAPSGKSHVYGQDADGLGLWRITHTAGKGFQFQCVGNNKYISYTMGNSDSANKYYWQCFAEGSLYDPLTALKVSGSYLAYLEMQKMLQKAVDDEVNITCDEASRTAMREALAQAQPLVDGATTEDEILRAAVALRAAGCTFLNSITLAENYQMNVTPLLINASFPANNAKGWEGTEPGFQTFGNAEFYSKSYDLHQTLPDMPQGTYMLRVQGYQRSLDSNEKTLTNYLNGTLKESEGYLYANREQTPLALVARDAQTTNAIGGKQYTISGKSYWMPSSMSEANTYFNNGKYWNNLTVNHLTRGDMTIGLRSSVGSGGSWTCFDNFELYFQGEPGDVSDLTYLITNPSFETGTTDGWTTGHPSGNADVGAKKNQNEYLTEGTVGDYLFNTWVNGDSYLCGAGEQFVEQTLTNMKPGEYRLTALASSNTYSSVNAAVELYGNGYVSSFVPQSKSTFKQTYEVTIYLMPSETSLTIGMRSAGWFRADDFHLVYFGQTDNYEKERRMATVDRYEVIASQALDRSAYDIVLGEVRTALMSQEITDEEIASQNARLRIALMELIKTGTTATGQFDLSILLTNSDIQRAANTSAATTLGQTLTDMPAGHYTFRANALYRPTAMKDALELYEAGTDDRLAYIFIGKKQELVPSIFDDARHTATSSADIYATIDGRSLPMNESIALSAFLLGDYATCVETDLETDGKLELGFRIRAAKKADNWFLAHHMQLLYGATPDIAIEKQIPAGQPTPVCLPFALSSSETLQLYAIGSILDGKAQIYPVATIHAGEPCVVKSEEDIATFTIPTTKLREKKADTTPLPWDGGTITPNPDNLTWTHTFVDGKVTKAGELTFEVCDPLNMDFTVNLENLQARRFILLEDYKATTSTHIANYNQAPPARRDQPNNVGIPVTDTGSARYRLTYSEHEDMSEPQAFNTRLTDDKLIFVPNLIPQRTYYYEVKVGDNIVGKGRFHTDGHLRMIYAPSISNIRDLGGWQTADGQYIRYGLIYRGGEMNGGHTATAGDTKRLRNLGIGAEIDLRNDNENGSGTSVFGFTTGAKTFYYANGNDCFPENLSSQDSYDHWKAEFELILTNLRRGRNIYFHCIWGADRTGLLSMLLEGLLGVPQDRSNKNYELTSFSLAGIRVRGTQNEMYDCILGLSGATVQKKFNTFFVEKLGIKQADIDEFRSIMLTSDLNDGIDQTITAPETRQQTHVTYDLSGRILPTNFHRKGMYIRNGKKFVVQ